MEAFDEKTHKGARRAVLVGALACALVVSLYLSFVDRGVMLSEVEGDGSGVTVVIPDGVDRETLSRLVAIEMGWDDTDRSEFVRALVNIQWDAFNMDLRDELAEVFSWNEHEREIFLTTSARFLAYDPDILEYMYEPGEYEFNRSHSPAEISEIIVNTLADELKAPSRSAGELVGDDALDHLVEFIDSATDLLPDLALLPPQDVGLRVQGDRTYLVFSTTYFNIGDGDLELSAVIEEDPHVDEVREVYQRIQRVDGSTREVLVGEFQWHEEHLHYHFSDFATYTLTSLGSPDQNEVLIEKTTFCVRDVTQIEGVVDVDDENRVHFSCGRERQGVSVGWGDTYFHTYADQRIDVTDLPSGEYRLEFEVNPERRLKEKSYVGNTSSAVVLIDQEVGEVEVVELTPEEYPEHEHVFFDYK